MALFSWELAKTTSLKVGLQGPRGLLEWAREYQVRRTSILGWKGSYQSGLWRVKQGCG
jgi:hypothetical protein